MVTKLTDVHRTKDGEYLDKHVLGYCLESPPTVLKKLIEKVPIGRYKRFPFPNFMNYVATGNPDGYRNMYGHFMWTGESWGFGIYDSPENLGVTNLKAENIPKRVSLAIPLVVTGSLNGLVNSMGAVIAEARKKEGLQEGWRPRLENFSEAYINEYEGGGHDIGLQDQLVVDLITMAIAEINENGIIDSKKAAKGITLDFLIERDRKFEDWIEAAQTLLPHKSWDKLLIKLERRKSYRDTFEDVAVTDQKSNSLVYGRSTNIS